MTVYYYKDRFLKDGETPVPVEDRAFNYGDGIYEVVRFHRDRGFGLQEHLERLRDSAEAIRMALPFPLEEIESIVRSAVSQVEDEVVDVYFQISRGEAPRAHPFPQTDPVLSLYARPGRIYTEDFREAGVAVITLPDERWSNCYIKSLNLLPNVLAKQAAVEAGAYEAVLIRDGWVTEASASNVFGYHDGVFCTHPANRHILNGITRRFLLRAIEKLGFTVQEEPMSEEFFQNEVESAFITSTTMELMPISKINQRELHPLGPESPVWQVLQAFRTL